MTDTRCDDTYDLTRYERKKKDCRIRTVTREIHCKSIALTTRPCLMTSYENSINKINDKKTSGR